jgi:hypothetical protein
MDCVLGPLWVRAAAVAHGHQRSLAVINGSDEPQVIDPSTHAAVSMQGRRFGLWSRRSSALATFDTDWYHL